MKRIILGISSFYILSITTAFASSDKEREINGIPLSRIGQVQMTGPYASDNVLGIAPRTANKISVAYDPSSFNARIKLCNIFYVDSYSDYDTCISIKAVRKGTKIIAERFIALPSEMFVNTQYTVELEGAVVNQKCQNPNLNAVITETNNVTHTSKDICTFFKSSAYTEKYQDQE
jgi:hypothetical protein